MPVDRDLYCQSLSKEGAPNWPCPRCGGGHLRLIPESLNSSWTANTTEASNHEAFEASWVKQRFVALLKCDNGKCKEPVVVAGTGTVEEWPDEHLTEMLYEDVFVPTYVLPSPKLIDIPPNAPSAVVEELNQAFIASWSDFSSAGNRIRSATERLLDALRIPKTTVNARGKKENLTLHSRIDKTKTKFPMTHQSLLAVKWLGNAGSHSSALSRDAVFDALDIFEAVLHELYSTHPSAIKKLVAQVNARKGPSRAQKR
jgi:hypothetical protein